MLQKLSKDFALHCSNDTAKKALLLPKIILQSLNVWPDNDDKPKLYLMYLNILSLSVMAAAHFAYVLINITQITKMTSACTTVLVVIETIAKLSTMIYYKEPLNEILYNIWKHFWPTDIVSKSRSEYICFWRKFVVGACATFLMMAFFSNAQFMMFPLISDNHQLPMASWYPFDFTVSPIYEIMYVWQWFMNQIIVTTLSGFDGFLNALVFICASQFQVMQEILENMCDPLWRKSHKHIFKDLKYYDGAEEDFLYACVKHHLFLIKMVEMLEVIFSHIIFLQFVVSTVAMCVSSVALIGDPELWQHMLSYLIAHVFQFYIYCSVGNELSHQSVSVSEAAYYSEWQLSTNINFRKGLIMIIQRAQRPLSLTVAGLMQLSYANFLATIHLSFSFYTLLNSFV